jgi:hypothetical protein
MKNKTNDIIRILELADRVHVVNVFVEPTTEEELQELEHAKEVADRELLEFVKLCKIYLKEADGWLWKLHEAFIVEDEYDICKHCDPENPNCDKCLGI